MADTEEQTRQRAPKRHVRGTTSAASRGLSAVEVVTGLITAKQKQVARMLLQLDGLRRSIDRLESDIARLERVTA